jgi:hypothetical protein
MMKLISDYSVAVYSAQGCTLYNSRKAANLVDFSLSSDESPLDSQQLNIIQQGLVVDQDLNLSRIIILVPDVWLSVSQHRIDHLISPSLRPLAALSYAVETIFSPPDSLLFSYQYEVLSEQQCQLEVFACANEWAEQLYLPFQSVAKTCLLMPMRQWKAIQSRNRSWLSCSQRAMSVYQPEKRKRLKARRLCWSLVVFSLLVHSVASVYYLSLHQESTQALIARQTIQTTQSAWSMADNDNDFSTSVLSLVQALPMSARLGSFESEDQRAFLKMTLPTEDLTILLVAWRQQNPDWRWDVKQQPHYLASPMAKKEVMDVSIEIFKS